MKGIILEIQHQSVPADHGHVEAASARLRQAHDLLPLIDPHARRDTRHPHHLLALVFAQ